MLPSKYFIAIARSRMRWNTISTLHQLGWSIEEICQSLGWTRALVESDLRRFENDKTLKAFRTQTNRNERFEMSWRHFSFLHTFDVRLSEIFIRRALKRLLRWDVVVSKFEKEKEALDTNVSESDLLAAILEYSVPIVNGQPDFVDWLSTEVGPI